MKIRTPGRETSPIKTEILSWHFIYIGIIFKWINRPFLIRKILDASSHTLTSKLIDQPIVLCFTLFVSRNIVLQYMHVCRTTIFTKYIYIYIISSPKNIYEIETSYKISCLENSFQLYFVDQALFMFDLNIQNTQNSRALNQRQTAYNTFINYMLDVYGSLRVTS